MNLAAQAQNAVLIGQHKGCDVLLKGLDATKDVAKVLERGFGAYLCVWVVFWLDKGCDMFLGGIDATKDVAKLLERGFGACLCVCILLACLFV